MFGKPQASTSGEINRICIVFITHMRHCIKGATNMTDYIIHSANA